MLTAMKTLTVIGAFRSFLCHSWPVAFCWPDCQLSSNSVVVSFALVRHSLLRGLHSSVLGNEWENGERAGCDSDACQESTR